MTAQSMKALPMTTTDKYNPAPCTPQRLHRSLSPTCLPRVALTAALMVSLVLALILALALPVRAFAATLHLHVIELQHRSAEEAIPLVKPFVAAGGAVTGTGYKLIVRTTDENFTAIQQLIAEIDTAPRQLMVTVRQSSDSSGRSQGARINGQIRSDNGQLSVRGQGQVYSTESRDSNPGEQRLQVQEGQWATIHVGQSVPIVSRQVLPNGSINDTVQYKAVTSGFDVLARVHGDLVTLSIRPIKAALSPQGGGIIDEQQAQTTVSGRLGTWITLGGISETRSRSGSGTVYQTESHSNQVGTISVRVDPLTP